MSRPLRVAVIGSGPSGIYACDALVGQSDIPIEVDIIDRLPVPFGLVRYGVAPDHLSIRSVRDTLDKTLDKPGVRFLGNVVVGQDLTMADLHDHYDAILLTYGASRDRRLDVPGEDLGGSIAATDFVAWYCGHPDADRLLFEDLIPRAQGVVVVGVGSITPTCPSMCSTRWHDRRSPTSTSLVVADLRKRSSRPRSCASWGSSRTATSSSTPRTSNSTPPVTSLPHRTRR
jgi:hypothetical protein